MSSGVGPERQRLLDYLAEFGLDGMEIDGVDFDAKNFTLIRHERTRHPWPEGFDFDWFSNLLLVANRADFRRAGARSPV